MGRIDMVVMGSQCVIVVVIVLVEWRDTISTRIRRALKRNKLILVFFLDFNEVYTHQKTLQRE